MAMRYTFDEEEMAAAAKAWGCNCGPSALAFALQIGLDPVHKAMPEFDARGYTSPTMMKAAIDRLGWGMLPVADPQIEHMCGRDVRLVRIQWAGPWTAPGMNPRWAYGQTHWIATYPTELVFDCNCGSVTLEKWIREVVPHITSHIKRANGQWFPTHVWRISPRRRVG